MSSGISPLALNRVRAQEALKAELAALKAEEATDKEVAMALGQAHKLRRSTAMEFFEPKPWRLEIAELRIANAKLTKDLEFSRSETESMVKRNLVIEKKMQELQQTILFYGQIIDTYKAKLGPYAEQPSSFDTDKLYD